MILFFGFYYPFEIPKTAGQSFTIYFITDAITVWLMVLAICGYAKKYLNKPTAALRYLNKAVYPFFIIHQTIIVGIGYWVVQWQLSILVKFLLLTFLSSITIFLVYHYLIKRT